MSQCHDSTLSHSGGRLASFLLAILSLSSRAVSSSYLVIALVLSSSAVAGLSSPGSPPLVGSVETFNRSIDQSSESFESFNQSKTLSQVSQSSNSISQITVKEVSRAPFESQLGLPPASSSPPHHVQNLNTSGDSDRSAANSSTFS